MFSSSGAFSGGFFGKSGKTAARGSGETLAESLSQCFLITESLAYAYSTLPE
jgi:hypothetical protein